MALTVVVVNKPYEKTPEGQWKYHEAMIKWDAQFGPITDPTWGTWHFPLTLGTAPLGSGECFGCGMVGHRRPTCPVTNEREEILGREGNWCVKVHRAIYTLNTTNDTNDTLPVFLINGDYIEVDLAIYNVMELDFTEDQENE